MNKEILKRIISNSYLYICTRDLAKYDVIDKLLQRLDDLCIVTQDTKTENYRIITITSNSFFLSEKFLYFSKINDQDDYSLGKLIDIYPDNNHIEDYDTLISCAFLNNKNFLAYSDYLGIMPHYYFYDKVTFISSNNSFLVALIAEKNVSVSSVYETFFFRFPYGSNSYFDHIKILDNFKFIQYDFCNHILKTPSFSRKTNFPDLYVADIDTGVADFWSRIKKPDKKVMLSFSGGSDSMTILSLLDCYGIQFDLCAFEGHNSYDTKRIQELAFKLGHKIFFFEVKKATSLDINEEYTIVSNGNAISTHFHTFYNLLKGVTMFDGYSFALGDWSDAFISDIHKEILLFEDLEKSINFHFAGFDSVFLSQMKMYFEENYSFPQINANDAISYIQQYSVDFITKKVLSGVLSSSLYFGINNYSFFLSKKFICPILRNGYGISNTFFGRDDYQGYIANRQPLSYISSLTGSSAFLAKMDHGISLKEIGKADRLTHISEYVYKKRRTINAMMLKIRTQSTNYQDGITANGEIEMPDFVSHSASLTSYAKTQIRNLNSVSNSLLALRKMLIS